MHAREHRITTAAPATLLALLALHYALLFPHLSSDRDDFDALHVYLPLAARLANEGFAFLLQEASIHAPPLSYAFPALLGGSLSATKIANAALSGVTLVLVFRSAWLVHSLPAGFVAGLAFAGSPVLRPFLATAITEPPYLLLSALWFWGLAEWLYRGRRTALWIAGPALGLACLARAAPFFGLLLLVLVLALLASRTRGELAGKARAALATHAAGLLLPAAFIAKNLVVFGFPLFVTGGGNALYLGNHPVTGGYDANYVGLLYDVGSVARDQSQLTLQAEQLLRATAGLMIREQPVMASARLHARKLAAFVFVSNAEPGAPWLRAWRIALLVLGAAGAWALRRRLAGLVLLGMLAYQVAVHVPVLYTHRYSVGAMDLWLTVLAAVGLAEAVASRNRLAQGAMAAVAAGGIALGTWAPFARAMPQPDVYAGGRMTIWQRPLDLAFPAGAPTLEFDVAGERFHPWLNYVLVLEFATGESECSELSLAYRRPGHDAFGPAVVREIRGAAWRRVQVGGVPLGLKGEGRVRLRVKCITDATPVLARAAVISPMVGIDVRSRLLRETPPFPLDP